MSTIHEFCNRKLNIKKWWVKTWHKPLKIFLYTGQKLTQIKYCKKCMNFLTETLMKKKWLIKLGINYSFIL